MSRNLFSNSFTNCQKKLVLVLKIIYDQIYTVSLNAQIITSVLTNQKQRYTGMQVWNCYSNPLVNDQRSEKQRSQVILEFKFTAPLIADRYTKAVFVADQHCKILLRS